MSALLSLREQITDSQRCIERYEDAIAKGPESPALLVALRSALKQHEKLEAEFSLLASADGLDVCRYRLIAEAGDNYRVATLGNALVAFQSLVTTVYDAIVNRPKSTGRVGADVAEKTAFEFGYAFAGSVGFVMTMPNDRLLGIESDLDSAFDGVFRMVKETQADEIRQFADEYGTASIRALKKWASFHTLAHLDADVKWLRGDKLRRSVFVQNKELSALESALSRNVKTFTEQLTLEGELRGADVTAKTFRMFFESGVEIKGRFEDAIDESHRASLPMRYRAELTKHVKSDSLWEDEEVTYFLEALHSLD